MDESTTRAVCGLFGLGAPRGALDAVAGGLTNRLWRLPTTRGVFAVKQMNRDFERGDYVAWIERAFSLEQAAFGASIPVPRPMPVLATGRCLAELPSSGGAPVTVRVHEWVDGVKLENDVVYPDDVLTRVAAILARIHALRVRANASPRDALHVFGDEYWRALAGRAEREGAEWAPDLRRLLPVLRDLEAYLAAAHGDATPLLLSHRDSDQKNFIRTPAGELLLVDWDQAGPVNPRQDLANHALVWAGVHRDDPDRRAARTFVAAYRSAAGVRESFRETDLAELVTLRLGWFDFNVRRALGERVRDESDQLVGASVIRRNVIQLPRFARSLSDWLVALGD